VVRDSLSEHELHDGHAGLALGTAIAKLANPQSAAISAAPSLNAGHVRTSGAGIAILAALTSNTFSEAAVAGVLGGASVTQCVAGAGAEPRGRLGWLGLAATA
jgi:uncharacterized membrane protein (DUF4010 family)